MRLARAFGFCMLLASAITASSCKRPVGNHTGPSPSVSSSNSASSLTSSRLIGSINMAPNLPLPLASVENRVNPKHEPPYAGPAGAIEGVVRIRGDQAPTVDLTLPPACAGAASTYGRLFREGPGRTAADVWVAVQGFRNYVPAKAPSVRVRIKDCAYDRKTVVVTFGQQIEVANDDSRNSYVPYLEGSRMPAHLALVPGGDPVKLYPMDIGNYLLVDEMKRPWMEAKVIVLNYSLHAVTGLDGRYRIEGIPVGEMDVGAFLPSVKISSKRKVTIEADKTVTADFELEYVKPTPAASASAGPKAPIVR